MKKNFIVWTVLALIFIFTAAVSASEIRVSQLGSAWLVPDAYMDVIANPARVNFIGKAIFAGGVDNFLFKQTEIGAADSTTWTFVPKAAYMGNFGGMGAGLIYRASYTVMSSDYSDGTYMLDNYITPVFGMKLGDKLSAGIDLNITTHADSTSPSRGGAGRVRLGVNYSMDGMDFGAVLSAANTFSGLENGDFMLSLLGEIKIGGDSVIRFINDTNGGFVKINPVVDLPVNPFDSGFFGMYAAYNRASASYCGGFNSISYFISLHDDWDIIMSNRTGSAVPGSIIETNAEIRKNNLYLQAGFETKLFADWFTIRGAYTPLAYIYERQNSLTSTHIFDIEGSTETNTVTLFDAASLRLGFGVNFGQDMMLDVEFKYSGAVSYYHAFNRQSTYPDFWTETGYLPVNVEYTMRF